MVDEENSNRLQEESQQQQQQPSAPSSSYYRYKVTTGSLSEKTRYAYTLHINDFLAYFKIADIAPLQEYSPKLIKQMVKDYVLFLRDVRKLAHSSINLHVSAVAHFFHKIRDDDYRIDWSKAREEIPPDENIRRDRGYTVEEIQKMLSVCYRTREKVIIHLLESTGMRIGAIHSIRIADLSPKSTKQGKVYRIEVYARSSASYFAYCNTETAKTIDAYQKERTDAGETLMNDTPLIRNLYSSLSVKAKKKVSDSQIKYIVDRIVKLSGIKNTFQFTGEARRGKGFRKWYKTQAEMAGMKPINVELTHGHSIGVPGRYFTPSETQVLEDYMTHAAEALTIDPTNRLKKRVDELETEQAQEIAQLRAQLSEYKEFASKTAAEINDLKASRGPDAYEYAVMTGDPNFSNIIDAVNDLRARNGQEPVAIITPEDKAAKIAHKKSIISHIKDSIECRKRGIPEENPFPETIEDKVRQIKELELEIKEIEAKTR